eukprot:TRINITY_DN29717_c0_g1_i1.p2 TRINITY_DN29717_c0_g1~~TRINITY_DN29717_c0_g1_i1.p2  ORF type:complete len:328 (+),score=149.24 TRINITY_DN29717_c0_g1_i1:58-1041(+)
MKNASTPPAFRMWTPTGETFPGIGASAVGFGKAATDVDSKWFNKDTWKVESYLKRDAEQSQIWVDPVATKNAKGGNVNLTFGYDNASTGVKYRASTDDSMKHTSEVAYTLPLLDGTQRVKVAVNTALEKDTFLPKTDSVATKIFWKAMMPQYTAEAIVKQNNGASESLNVWVQGEVNPDFAYGGIAEYSFAKKALKVWEFGLLNTVKFGTGMLATRAVTRNGNEFELGVLPPKQEVAGYQVQSYAKVNHNLDSGATDLAVTGESKICPVVDVKAKFSFAGLADMQTAFAAIWSAPNGWKVAASLTNPGSRKSQFGVRLAQGSTPPPL